MMEKKTCESKVSEWDDAKRGSVKKIPFNNNLKTGTFNVLKMLRINQSRTENLATYAIGDLWSTKNLKNL